MNRYNSKSSNQTSASRKSSKAGGFQVVQNGETNENLETFGENLETVESQEQTNAKLREQLKMDVKMMKAGTASFGQGSSGEKGTARVSMVRKSTVTKLSKSLTRSDSETARNSISDV